MRANNLAAGPIEPIAPEELGIARLARRKKGEAGQDSVPKRAGETRLVVGLHRDSLAVDDHAMYFRLKMALARGLRRPFRRALIEVDDLDPPAGERAFEITVEPPDAVLQARAEAVVARVIRWRRWAMPAPDGESVGQGD